jgi:hypothetical protein
VRDGSLLIKDLAGVSASGGIRGPQGQKGPTGDQRRARSGTPGGRACSAPPERPGPPAPTRSSR